MSEFIQDLKTKVFCRLGVSKIHGVGVIAIRDIPKGINPMQEGRPFEFQQVKVADVVGDSEIPKSVKKLVVDMCPENDGEYDCPPFSLNGIGISWYLNHSTTPNMEEKDGEFFSIQDIPENSELTVDYGTYGALNL